MNIFNLFAKVTLNIDEYKKGLKEAEKQAETSSEKIQYNLKGVTRANEGWADTFSNLYNQGRITFEQFKEYLSSYNIKLEEAAENTEEVSNTQEQSGGKIEISWKAVLQIILKIIQAIKQLISETIEYSNEIYEVAQQFDMTTESVSELQYMASQTGTTLSTITNAMTQLERKAASENSVFEELGVSITDANGKYKSMETVLFDTIGALNDLNDESEKSAYMSQLFGRTSMTNAELFRLSADEIANLRQQSEDLGITMSESTAQLGANITRQKEALKLQGQSALSALLAGDEDAEEKLQEFFTNLIAMAERFLPNIISFVLNGFHQLFNAIIRTLPELVMSLVSNIIGFFLDYWFSGDWIQFGIDWAKSVAEGFLNIFVSTINGLFGWLGVDIPKVDFGVGENLFSNDLNTEYEISERMQQDITVKVEASGDTAVSKESAEKTAEALAPYIDKILGGK